MTDELRKLLPELSVIRAIVSEERLKELAASDASDQIVNSKSDLANMVRILTMQRDQANSEIERLRAIEVNSEDVMPVLAEAYKEVERLREALKDIAALNPLTQGDIAVRRAKKALKE